MRFFSPVTFFSLMLCLTFKPCLPTIRALFRENALMMNMIQNHRLSKPSILLLGEDILRLILLADYSQHNQYNQHNLCNLPSRLGQTCYEVYKISRYWYDQYLTDFWVHIHRKSFQEHIF